MSDSFEDRGEFTPDQSPDTSINDQDTEQAAVEAIAAEPNGFVTMGLAPELVQACTDLGYTQPTAVQKNVIPKAFLGEGEKRFADLMVSSQTGSGKTAAFLLPVLHTLLAQRAAVEAEERAEFEQATADALAKGEAAPKRPKRKDPTNPRNFKAPTPGALIVCPTRELAQQVANDAIDLVRHCRGLRVANVVGGMPYQLQIAKLQNADLVVATPGRLLDLQRSQQLKLDKVQFLVVDEADRMLDLGFSDDLADINDLTSQRGQTMMFSATFAPRIQQLAMRVMHDGGKHVQKVQIDSPQEQHSNITQKLFWADNAQHKRSLARPLVARHLDQPGGGVLQHAGGMRWPGQRPAAVQLCGCGVARCIEPGHSQPPPDGLAQWPGADPGGDRCGRSRYRRAHHHPRVQLRSADEGRGLHPPHWPHRPCRSRWSGHHVC